MISTRTVTFLISFFAFFGVFLIFLIPFVLVNIRKRNGYSPGSIVQIIVQITTFISIIAILSTFITLSIFSYVPWWGTGIINVGVMAVIFVLWIGNKRKISFTNFMILAVCLILLSGCWIASYLTQNICISKNPLNVSFYINRRGKDTCNTANNVPCHIYTTFGKNTSSEIVVHFHSSVKYEKPIIYYGLNRGNNIPSNYEFSITPKHESLDIEVERYVYYGYIRDLIPDTTYYISAGFLSNNGTYYSAKEQMIKTTPRTGAFNFISGGDMGVNDETRKLVGIGATYEPYFAAIGGNLAYSEDYVGCYSLWDDFLTLWQERAITPNKYNVPIISSIGARDAGGYNQNKESYFSKYFIHEESNNPSLFHSHYVSNSVILSLDASVVSSPESQNNFIEKELSKDFNAKIALYSIPMYPSIRSFDNKWSTELRENWAPLFDKYDLNIALENGDNAYKRSVYIKDNKKNEDGTIYIGDGCWGAEPYPISEEDIWYIDKIESKRFFLAVDVQSDTINISAVDINGKSFDNVVIDLN